MNSSNKKVHPRNTDFFCSNNIYFNYRDNENKVNELQTTIDNLKTSSVRPSTKSIGVVTTLSNIQLVSQYCKLILPCIN